MGTRRHPIRLQETMQRAFPRTLKETFADALLDAEREFRDAQCRMSTDCTDDARARYARALAKYDALQGMFPFVAAGAGDEEV